MLPSVQELSATTCRACPNELLTKYDNFLEWHADEFDVF